MRRQNRSSEAPNMSEPSWGRLQDRVILGFCFRCKEGPKLGTSECGCQASSLLPVVEAELKQGHSHRPSCLHCKLEGHIRDGLISSQMQANAVAFAWKSFLYTVE